MAGDYLARALAALAAKRAITPNVAIGTIVIGPFGGKEQRESEVVEHVNSAIGTGGGGEQRILPAQRDQGEYCRCGPRDGLAVHDGFPSDNSANSVTYDVSLAGTAAAPTGGVCTTALRPTALVDNETADEPNMDGLAAMAPPGWQAGCMKLMTMSCPSNMAPAHWKAVREDCAALIMGGWAAALAQHGWDTHAVFGCHPVAPTERHDHKGVLLDLAGGRIIKVTTKAVYCRTRRNAAQKISKPDTRPFGQALIWNLVGRET